jgi:hypothetical protein
VSVGDENVSVSDENVSVGDENVSDIKYSGSAKRDLLMEKKYDFHPSFK